MDFFQRFFLFLSVAAAVCLAIGLFRPWVMLWWEDTQNRKKVIKLYGGIALISYALYWGLNLIYQT